MYQCILKRKNDQIMTNWSGGSTRELVTWPKNTSATENEECLFEVTSSTMDYEETDYTVYIGFDSILMVIDGEMLLEHEDGTSTKLTPYKIDRFNRDIKTRSKGLATDYEIMLKKGCVGDLSSHSLDSDSKLPFRLETDPDFSISYHGFYCAHGQMLVCINQEEILINEGDQLSVFLSENYMCNAILSGNGILIKSIVLFNS